MVSLCGGIMEVVMKVYQECFVYEDIVVGVEVVL